MSNYFILRLLVDFAISVILLRMLGKASRIFKKKHVKKAYLIYVPTVLSLILILQVVFFMGPKLVDAVRLGGGGIAFAQIEVAEMRRLPGSLTDTHGQTFYYNPLKLKAAAGERYSVRYLPNSRYIVEVEMSKQVPGVSDEGVISE